MKSQLTTLALITLSILFIAEIGFAQSKLERRKENRLERLKMEQMMFADPQTHQIPDQIREKELNYVYGSKAQLLPAFDRSSRSLNTTTDFQIRGPFNVGGRTRAIGIDTRDPDIIMIGGASGGLYRTTNGGTNWTLVSNTLANPSITGIAQDPTSLDTWYYITGEASGTVDVNVGGTFYLGDGVSKSTDNGVTWNQLSSTNPSSDVTFGGGSQAEWQLCHDIAIDPIDGAVLVTNLRGIYRSTNGGSSWTRVLNATSSFSSDVTHLDVVETGTNSRIYYAGTHSSGVNNGFFQSTDGQTWSKITNPNSMPNTWERIEVAIAPSNTDIAWFLVSNDQQEYRLYKYDDSSPSWTERSDNLPALGGDVGDLDTQASYNMIMTVKPDDEDYIFIAGTSLYRSSDGFSTALNTNNTGNTQWIGGYSPDNDISSYPNHHPDVHALVFVPNSNSAVWCGHDGGVSQTTDITTNHGTPSGFNKPHPVTWTSPNNGYYTTQAYSIAIDPSTSGDNRILLGFQDNSNWSVNSDAATAIWSEEIGGGDGAYGTIVAGENTRYHSVQNGSVVRVTGTNPSNPSTFHHVHPAAATGQLFVNPFILDKNNQDIMYYPSGRFLWRHNDVSSINTGFDFDGTNDNGWSRLTSATISSGSISAITVSQSPANTAYYGTSNGDLYKLTNAHTGTSPSRTNITDNSFPSNGFISSIAVDDTDADKVIVTFSNYSVISIFSSTDGGDSWTNVSGNLEENEDGSGNGPSLRWIAIHHPSSDQTIYYAGASTGLYSTETLNGTNTNWTQESTDVIGNVPVSMIKTRTSDGLVAVATHGKGAFSANVINADNNTGSITIDDLEPANNSTNTSITTDLAITFNMSVTASSGDITIHNGSDDSMIETISVTSDAVTVDGATVTITPTNSLPAGETIYIQVEEGAFINENNDEFSGITSTNTWSFTTLSDDITTINDLLNQAVKVYPNPASETIIVSIEELKIDLAKAELYATNGQLVAEKLLKPINSNDLQGGIDLSQTAAGHYILKIITPHAITSKSIVVE